MDYYKQFKKHVANQSYSTFLPLWEEYCSSDEIDPYELNKILKEVQLGIFSDSFGRHVEEILTLWELLPESKEKDEALRLILDLQTTNSEQLANIALKFLEEKYGDDAHFGEKIKLIGLRDGSSFKGAIRDYELLTHMKAGNFVFHTSGWGVGEILEVSVLREELSIEFEYVAGPKDLTFQNAFNTLIAIPDEHFLARRFGDPDKLEVEAKENPLPTIHMLLRDLGPKTASEIKDELFELVIPENDWTKWWQACRSKLKKDTKIQVPRSLSEPFILREEEVSHEDLFQKALMQKPDVATFIQMVYSFIRDFSASLKNVEFVESLKSQITEILSNQELTDAEALQLHFFLEDLGEKKETEAVYELVRLFPSIFEVIDGIGVIAFKKRLLSYVRKVRDDWDSVFLPMFFKTDQSPLREYILTELFKAKKQEAFTEKLRDIINHPQKAPSAVIWYMQKVMQKDSYPYGDDEGKNTVFESLLTLLYFLEQGENKDQIKKILSFITNARFANVRKIFGKASKELVQEFLLLSTKCRSLTDHDKKILHSLAEVVHPSLSKLRKKYDGEEEKEKEPIWTTEEGFLKLKDRLHNLATVETVENAKEIEAARALGDLRENSEFKFALERRDRIQGEIKTLSDQLNQARVLTAAEVFTDTVAVGTIVECEDAKGATTSYTLLGPWDADADKNILSFQSKLAMDMIGLSRGDSFKIKNTEWTITEIKNYFHEMQKA